VAPLALRLDAALRGLALLAEHTEDLTDSVLALERMSQRKVGVKLIAVSSPVAVAVKIAGVNEVGDDPLGGALGDPDACGDVTKPNAGVTGNADQHVGVVGEKRPVSHHAPVYDMRRSFRVS
jgi:hypothetical protein